MDGKVDGDILAAYVGKYTQPVQWVDWWLNASDPAAAEVLRLILFKPQNDTLVDLTTSGVRQAIVLAVLANPSLRETVGSEFRRFLESTAERLARDGGQCP